MNELAMALQPHRDAAAARLAEASKPSRNDEKWLGADLASWTADAVPGGSIDAPSAILPRAADGVRILSLDSDDEVIRQHFGASIEPDPFTDQNTVHFQGGLLIDALPGCDASIEVLRHVEGDEHPRLLVHAQAGARITVLERFVVADGARANAVTELDAHADAHITHVRTMEGPGKLLHGVFGRAQREASITQHNLSWTGASVRGTGVIRLLGEGAHATLNGLSLTDADERVDHWTRIDHAVPDGTSAELYKSVLAGKSRARFTGNLMVRPGAQRTSAEQENRNLLLSTGALAESTPQLEIHADDVQCSHGSTVGRLDEDALFFLRSRGIGEAEATVLLTKAFAAEVVNGLPEAVRPHVEAAIEAWFEEKA